jgi:hypothetical protein
MPRPPELGILLYKSKAGAEYRVRHLGARHLDTWENAKHGLKLKTDCRLLKVSASGDVSYPKLNVRPSPETERSDLRAFLSEDLGWAYWHRCVAFAFQNPQKRTWKQLRNRESHHTDGKWWVTRRSSVAWRTPAENRAAQGEDGMAGPAGSRKRKRPPSWARADWE